MGKVAVLLDEVYKLSSGQQAQQRALEAAGVCAAVASLLAAPALFGDAALLEKCLRASRVLCRHGGLKATRDEANAKVLAGAGVCEGALIDEMRQYSILSLLSLLQSCK